MVFKAGFVIMAPDGDPKAHRASIRTSKLELSVVVTQMKNVEQAVDVCKELVQSDGVQDIILCPGFTHEMVAKIKAVVGEKVAVSVARGDAPSAGIVREILAREGWFS